MSIYTTIQKVYTKRMKYKVRHKEVILLKNTCFLGVIQQDINNALCFYADEHTRVLTGTIKSYGYDAVEGVGSYLQNQKTTTSNHTLFKWRK